MKKQKIFYIDFYERTRDKDIQFLILNNFLEENNGKVISQCTANNYISYVVEFDSKEE